MGLAQGGGIEFYFDVMAPAHRSFSLPHIAVSRRVWIYVDALDECGEDAARDLVAFFKQLVSESAKIGSEANMRICFSCRKYPQLTSSRDLVICVNDQNAEDIITYVDRKLLDCSLDEHFSEYIVERSNGIFQWVVLAVQLLLQLDREGHDAQSIKTRLGALPQELSQIYGEIIDRVPHNDREELLRMMQWICFAAAPLTVVELMHSAMRARLDARNFAASEIVGGLTGREYDRLSKRVGYLSGGLAEVKEYPKGERVQLIHQSVRDYFVERRLEELGSSPGITVASAAHSWLSDSCARYLFNIHIVLGGDDKHLLSDRSTVFVAFPFLWYSVISFCDHAQMAEEQHEYLPALLQYFNWPSNGVVRLWLILAKRMVIMCLPVERQPEFEDMMLPLRSGNKVVTLLHVAAGAGLSSLIEMMALSPAKQQAPHYDDYEALRNAISGSHVLAYRMLLENWNSFYSERVDLEKQAYEVASRGSNEMMEALIDHCRKKGTRYISADRASLIAAERRDNRRMVDLLLASDPLFLFTKRALDELSVLEPAKSPTQNGYSHRNSLEEANRFGSAVSYGGLLRSYTLLSG